MSRKHKQHKGTYDYKVLNIYNHPCRCADLFPGPWNHNILQWGRPYDMTVFSGTGIRFKTQQ